MLAGKTLSVPIMDVVHRDRAKDYAMDIQASTKGYTKLRLKATIVSKQVEWHHQRPTIRIKWEVTSASTKLVTSLFRTFRTWE